MSAGDRTTEGGSSTPGPGGGATGQAFVLIAGEGNIATRALDKPELTIGRADDCDIVVRSATLSRRHAVIRRGPPLTVQDLGSRNGTRIGGELKKGGEATAVAGGDAFHIGPISFVIMDGPHAATSVHSDFERPLRVLDPTYEGVATHIREIAKSGSNVLILGETGVGKEVLADTLHRWSERSGPLVRINCATLSANLLESELFGHEKGAFTGATDARPGLLASAKAGTVLLDEVGELPLPLQAKLLRAIETKEVLRLGATRPVALDVRFIAATNRNLPADVAEGLFRADLFFRLDGMTLLIPPLRARRPLIAQLALRFTEDAQRAQGKPLVPLPAGVVRKLSQHNWPGNVRELKAAVERAILLARGGELKVNHFGLSSPSVDGDTGEVRRPSGDETPPPARRSETAEPPARKPEVGASAPSTAAEDERSRIVEALAACAGNQTRAAQKLGISRATLATKLLVHRIPRPRS